MYAEVLREIEGIAIFPIVSLLLFVVLFSTVLIWASRLDRSRLDQLARLPLDDEPRASNQRTKESEL